MVDFTKNKEMPEETSKNESLLIQVDDLNTMVTFFKRREENIIQILDLKYKNKSEKNQELVNLLNSHCKKIKEIEEKRIEQEDQILAKFSKLKVSDEKQRRLIERFIHKITQITSKVREKLLELSIFDQAKTNWQEVSLMEQTLRVLVKKYEINVDILLMYLAMASRLRILNQFQGNNRNNLLYNQAKETLQELINSNIPEPQPNLDVNTHVNPPKCADLPLELGQEVCSYPFKPYPLRHPPIQRSPFVNYPSHENSKLSNPAGERSASVSPHLDTSSINQPNQNNQKSRRIKNLIDIKPKKELIPHRELRTREPIIPELPEGTIPTFKITTNLETVSSRERTKDVRGRQVNENERICKTYEFNTQESDYGADGKDQTFPSCERMIRFDTEGNKANQFAFALRMRQLCPENEKDFDYLRNPVDLKRAIPNEKSKNTQRIYDIISQKMRELPSVQKIRINNYKDSTPRQRVLSQSQPTENETLPTTSDQETFRGLDQAKTIKVQQREESPIPVEPPELKNMKSNPFESWKNYDIMNIEYKPVYVTTKANIKKMYLDRIYYELLGLNNEIKKTITKYYSLHNGISKRDCKTTPREYQKTTSMEASKENTFSDLKPVLKSKRSVSIDNNVTNLRQTSKISQKKSEKDLKGSLENSTTTGTGTSRGSVPQILNTIMQTHILNKIQSSKPQQKIVVLPKLNIIDTQKPPTQNSEVLYLISNSQFPPLISHKYFKASASKKINSKKLNEIESIKQKDLLLITPSGQRPMQTHTTTNKNSSVENTLEDLNYSTCWNDNEQQPNSKQKEFQDDVLTNPALKKKLQLVGYTLFKKDDFMEGKQSSHIKFNLITSKNYAKVSERAINLSPARNTPIE